MMHSHFEDIERFMSHWQDDPLGFCSFVGRAVARLASRNFNDLFFCIGTSYCAYHCLPDRIDYLYEHFFNRIGGIKGDTIKEMIALEVDFRDTLDDVICITDKTGRHGNIKLMIWRSDLEGHLTYFLRPFGEEFDLEDCGYWNFRRSEEITDGVIVYPEARGFYDLAETKSVADLIVLASNFVGFTGCQC